MNITAGKFKGQKIVAPDANITRPTLSKVRMSVFNTLQSMIDFENKSFLDMYCGSGIMGLEALSRGFSKIRVVEKNKKAFFVAKNNYTKFEKNADIKLILWDSLTICKKFDEKFDVIYIDPPYFEGIYEKSLQAIKNISAGIIILEHVKEVDLSGFEIIKLKQYAEKYLTFLSVDIK